MITKKKTHQRVMHQREQRVMHQRELRVMHQRVMLRLIMRRGKAKKLITPPIIDNSAKLTLCNCSHCMVIVTVTERSLHNYVSQQVEH